MTQSVIRGLSSHISPEVELIIFCARVNYNTVLTFSYSSETDVLKSYYNVFRLKLNLKRELWNRRASIHML